MECEDQNNINKILHITKENEKEQTPTKTENSILSCIKIYIWPGMGLFGESYLLFSIGILRPIWELLYPNCFLGEECSPTLSHSISYSVILGVMIGMISLGILSDLIGRRYGSILTASFMSISSIGMVCITFLFGNDPKILFTYMSLLLFFFGIGVGGEYPLSASSASEKAILENKQTNGKSVILVFAMQGMGIFCNSFSLTVFLYIFGEVGDYNGDDAVYDLSNRIFGTYNPKSLLVIWRIVYSIGASVLFIVLLSRICCLKESAVWKEDVEYRKKQTSNIEPEEDEQNKEAPASPQTMCYLQKPNDNDDYVLYSDPTLSTLTEDNIDYSLVQYKQAQQSNSTKTKLLLSNYGMRLFGTCSTWLLWDVAFYGNKLFQSSFLLILFGNDNDEISEDVTLLTISLAITVNSTIALLGYYTAACIIDCKHVGRLRLQFYGFLITGTLFLLCGYIPKDRISSSVLILIYFGSSFFGQCGPNATTFLIPAEIFPTEKRSMCHGISAASGKLGAFLAAIVFNYLSDSTLFLLSGYCCFISCIITFITIPETNNLDLLEIDKRWRFIVNEGINNANKGGDEDDDHSENYHRVSSYGRKRYYCGPANDDRYLSFYEQLRKVYYKRYNR